MSDEKVLSIKSQLIERLAEGRSAEEAAYDVLAPYGGRETDPLCAFVWPMILKAARNLQGERGNRFVKRGVRDHPAGTGENEELDKKIRKTRIQFGDRTVKWDDLTMELVEEKIAWMRVHIGSLVDHLELLEHTRQLMVEHGVMRLGDISGWPELLRKRSSQKLDDVMSDSVQ